MPRPRKGPRTYTRERGGVARYYADFREFADVLLPEEGAGRMPLIADGDNAATTDPEIAQTLFLKKLEELRERKRTKAATGRWKKTALGRFAQHHLEKKAAAGKVVARWMQSVEKHLGEAVGFFGTDRDISTIGATDVQRYVEHLGTLKSGRGEDATLSPGSQRKYLNSLSNLYRRAISEGFVPPGFNPVAALMDKPTVEQREAEWLEVHDASLYLEACSRYKPPKDKHPIPPVMLRAIVATFLLTGGRKSEVLGLTVGDISFDRGKVTFRPHAHRRLKTRTSHRSVPLWPQLREVLVPYVASLGGPGPDALLFPSVRGNGSAMIQDLRKALDGAGELAGWKEGEIRTKMFRHTYTAARLQTATRVIRPGTEEVGWIPVSRDEVARELGHGGSSLVARVYGHVGDVRHRTDVVEYRVENHKKELGKRLSALRLAS